MNKPLPKRRVHAKRKSTLLLLCAIGLFVASGCDGITIDSSASLDIPTFVVDLARNALAALAT
ncbi:MAG: hypothetical protein H6817_01805 [Phycisphaerales bacterium]|nr:hypothetical protein [Phycisphaerales bacterium]